MTTRKQLIAELDEAYSEFRAAVEGLDEHHFEKKWLGGRWGAREIAAHVAGWLGQLGAGMERMSRGEKPAPEGQRPWTEVDAWNEVFARHSMGKRQDEVLHELEQALKSFRNVALRLPDDRYGEGKTANRMFAAAGAPHLKEHAGILRQWRLREGVPVG
jgi:hypothetical protein